MSNLFIVPENLAAMSGAYLFAATPASASMAAENILNERPSVFWRSSSVAPDKTYINVVNSKIGTISADTFALIGHNLLRGDQYRFIVSTGYPAQPAGYTAYAPNGTIGALTTNTGATHSDVDNNESETGIVWVGPTTTGSDWSIGLDFQTPLSSPVVGADRQAFWVFAKNGGSTTYPPVISADLYESGSFVATLRSYTVGSNVGQWFAFPFNAALLGTSTGANIQVKLSFTSPVSGYVKIWSVFLAADWISLGANDSGWLTYDPFVGGAVVSFRPQAKGKGSTALWKSPSAITGNMVTILTRAINSPPDFDSDTEILPTPSGYAQIGTFIYGERWSPTKNAVLGKMVGTLDASPSSRSYGGQLFGSRRPVRRAVSTKFDNLTASEGHTVLDRVLWRHGILKPFLISVMPDDAVQATHTTFLATIRNAENWLSEQINDGYENAMELEWEEAL